jgi:hypothetical protein
MKGDPVDDRNQQQRPMAAALGDFRIIRVVDREEDVSGFCEIRKSFLRSQSVNWRPNFYGRLVP